MEKMKLFREDHILGLKPFPYLIVRKTSTVTGGSMGGKVFVILTSFKEIKYGGQTWSFSL